MNASPLRRSTAVLFIVAGAAFAALGLFRFGGLVLMTLASSWLWILWPLGFLALAAALVMFAFAVVRRAPARVVLVMAAVGVAWSAATREAIIPSLPVGPTSIAAVLVIVGLLVGAVMVQAERDLAPGARLALLVAAGAGAAWWSGVLGQDGFMAFGGLLGTVVMLTFAAALIATGILLRRAPVAV